MVKVILETPLNMTNSESDIKNYTSTWQMVKVILEIPLNMTYSESDIRNSPQHNKQWKW